MPLPTLSRAELKIMEALWEQGPLSVREILETYPKRRRPAYTTVQTTVYRLEAKQALKRKKKIGSALIFEAVVSRNAARNRLIDELLELFGGRTQPLMSHLVQTGKLTVDDVEKLKLELANSKSSRTEPKS
jgi:predicted transcriptional regulator